MSKTKNNSLKFQRAASSFKNKQFDKSYSSALHLIKHYPTHYYGWLIKGMVEIEYEKYNKALISLSKASKFSRNKILVQLGIVESLNKISFFKDSLKLLREILSANPDSQEANYLNAWTLHNLHRQSESLKYALKSLELNPKCCKTLMLLGVLAKFDGKLLESIEHLRSALYLRLDLSYGPQGYKNLKKIFNVEENETILFDVLALFAKNGIKAFPTAGTLLGLEREGQLLAHDKDIDIGILFSQLASAKKLLLLNGWFEIDNSFGLVNPIAMGCSDAGICLDLCAFLPEKNTNKLLGGFWMSGIPEQWNRITEYPPLDLVKLKIKDRDIWYLRDPESWLTALYGDWRQPDKDFDTIIEAKNIRSFSPLVQYYAFSRIYKQWTNGFLSKAVRLIDVSLRYLPDDDLLLKLADRLQLDMQKQTDDI